MFLALGDRFPGLKTLKRVFIEKLTFINVYYNYIYPYIFPAEGDSVRFRCSR